ncbi:amidohydrolase family protein [Streptomyces spongiae]|uniref:Amidohydrolase family protein n=1 Tax=Streptomyces spongiae TaxID=565072 RepID=A0A5N8X8X8_9ACTN|nr:amidohydrolase family protein [Streptomyces spongiae]MPY55893.1 amidohydrolase family protein [Streptomyces spongiae]
MGKILISEGCVIDPDRTPMVMWPADVLVDGSVIAEVAQHIYAPDAEVIDARNHIVMPGLIDTHRHVWEGQIRNIAVDATLNEYSTVTLSGLAPNYRPEDAYAGELVGLLECVNAGVTSVFDWSHVQNSPEHTDAVVQAMKESGMRVVFGHGYPNDDLTAWMWESVLPHPEDARRVRSQYFSSDDQLLTMAIAARGPEYSTMKVVEHDWRLARELDCWISLHIGGGELGPKYEGITRMHELGLLGADMNYVHCTTLTAADFDTIKDTGGTISIAPAVEAQMGHGYPPVDEGLRRGIPTGLAADVVTSTAGDLFSPMHGAFSMTRARQTARALEEGAQFGSNENPEQGGATTGLITTRDVLRMATIDGARAVGLGDKVGSLAAGKQADILMLNRRALNLAPLHDPVGAVVTAATPANVDSVMVAGTFLKRHGRLVGHDLDHVLDIAQKSADYLTEKAGMQDIWRHR